MSIIDTYLINKDNLGRNQLLAKDLINEIKKTMDYLIRYQNFKMFSKFSPPVEDANSLSWSNNYLKDKIYYFNIDKSENLYKNDFKDIIYSYSSGNSAKIIQDHLDYLDTYPHQKNLRYL